MTLKKQSIRSNMHITANGEPISKEELIIMSELWSEKQEKAYCFDTQREGILLIVKMMTHVIASCYTNLEPKFIHGM